MKLTFSQLFSISEIENNLSQHHVPGIYIWGFENDNKQFIPYYVGDAVKSIGSRLLAHKKDLLKNDSTYRRPNESYFHRFYFDPEFPVYAACHNDKHSQVKPLYKDDEEWMKKNPETFLQHIFYANSIQFFNLKNISPQHGTAISQIPNRTENDIFINWMETKFRVMYYNIENCETLKESWRINKTRGRHYLEILEAFAKFSLKGKTGGKSLGIGALKKRAAEYAVDANIYFKPPEQLANYFNGKKLSEVDYHDFDANSSNPYFK